jgi:hypothetical protein
VDEVREAMREHDLREEEDEESVTPEGENHEEEKPSGS